MSAEVPQEDLIVAAYCGVDVPEASLAPSDLPPTLPWSDDRESPWELPGPPFHVGPFFRAAVDLSVTEEDAEHLLRTADLPTDEDDDYDDDYDDDEDDEDDDDDDDEDDDDDNDEVESQKREQRLQAAATGLWVSGLQARPEEARFRVLRRIALEAVRVYYLPAYVSALTAAEACWSGEEGASAKLQEEVDRLRNSDYSSERVLARLLYCVIRADASVAWTIVEAHCNQIEIVDPWTDTSLWELREGVVEALAAQIGIC